MKKEILVMTMSMALLGGCQKGELQQTSQEPSLQSDVVNIVETSEELSQEVPTEIISEQYKVLANTIDEYLNQEKFNGVALVASGEKLILVKGYGLSNVEQKEKMTIDKKFQIASVSKSFVAVSILQLVEAGKLSLTQTIDQFFPTLPHGEEITIHQLLTHTSALYSGDDLTNYTELTTIDEIIADAFKENNLYYEEPGVYAIYSNLGYDLLGVIIEQITGQTYAEYVKTHIFDPLEMTNSGLNMEGLSLENMATAYNGNISEGYLARVLHPSFGYASGGLHSTAMDLYKYDRALATNQLISKESYDLMTTAYSKIGNKDYGYGWYIDIWLDNTVSHAGNLIGWHSMLLRDQDDQMTVILLTNHDESDMNMAYNIGRLVLSTVNE